MLNLPMADTSIHASDDMPNNDRNYKQKKVSNRFMGENIEALTARNNVEDTFNVNEPITDNF